MGKSQLRWFGRLVGPPIWHRPAGDPGERQCDWVRCEGLRTGALTRWVLARVPGQKMLAEGPCPPAP